MKKFIENEAFVRIPLKNIKCKDSYEQYKLEKLMLTDPRLAVTRFEEAVKNMVVTFSFND